MTTVDLGALTRTGARAGSRGASARRAVHAVRIASRPSARVGRAGGIDHRRCRRRSGHAARADRARAAAIADAGEPAPPRTPHRSSPWATSLTYELGARGALGAPLADLLATNLARVPGLRVISAGRMLELVGRAGEPSDTGAGALTAPRVRPVPPRSWMARCTDAPTACCGSTCGGWISRPDAIVDVRTVEGRRPVRARRQWNGATRRAPRLVRALRLRGGRDDALARCVPTLRRGSATLLRARRRGRRTAARRGRRRGLLVRDGLHTTGRSRRPTSQPARSEWRARCASPPGRATASGCAFAPGGRCATPRPSWRPSPRAWRRATPTRWTGTVPWSLAASWRRTTWPPCRTCVARCAWTRSRFAAPHPCRRSCGGVRRVRRTCEPRVRLSRRRLARRRGTRGGSWTRFAPASPAAWIELASVLEGRGRPTEAVAALDSARRVDSPGSVAVQNAVAIHWIVVGNSRARDGAAAGAIGERHAGGAGRCAVVSGDRQSRTRAPRRGGRPPRNDSGRLQRATEPSRPRDASSWSALMEAVVLDAAGRHREAAALFDSVSRWRVPTLAPSHFARSRAWGMTHAANALAAAGDTRRAARARRHDRAVRDAERLRSRPAALPSRAWPRARRARRRRGGGRGVPRVDPLAEPWLYALQRGARARAAPASVGRPRRCRRYSRRCAAMWTARTCTCHAASCTSCSPARGTRRSSRRRRLLPATVPRRTTPPSCERGVTAIRLSVPAPTRRRRGLRRCRNSEAPHYATGSPPLGSVSVNVEPDPRVLSAVRSPPMPRARSRLMASPSPAPSPVRVRPERHLHERLEDPLQLVGRDADPGVARRARSTRSAVGFARAPPPGRPCR